MSNSECFISLFMKILRNLTEKYISDFLAIFGMIGYKKTANAEYISSNSHEYFNLYKF